MKNFIWVTFQVLALSLSSIATAHETADFVAQVKDEAFAVYAQKLPEEARFEKLCKIVGERANLQKMGELSLGRHIKKFSEAQLAVYLNYFKGAVVRLFDTSFSKMSEGVVTIDPNSREQNGAFTVTVMVEPPNRSAVRIQFYVSHPTEGSADWRIEDAAMSGIKLVFTKRSQFDAVMNRAAGESPGSEAATLIAELQKYEKLCP